MDGERLARRVARGSRQRTPRWAPSPGPTRWRTAARSAGAEAPSWARPRRRRTHGPRREERTRRSGRWQATNSREFMRDDDAAPRVGDGHRRHELLARTFEMILMPSEDDQGHHDNDGQADAQVGTPGAFDVMPSHGAGLHRRADAGEATAANNANAPRSRGPTTAPCRPFYSNARRRVHRAAQHVAVVVLCAVLHGGERFGVLRGHAGLTPVSHIHSTALAPAKMAVPTPDVAGADGGHWRRGQRAELADVTRRVGSFVTDSQ